MRRVVPILALTTILTACNGGSNPNILAPTLPIPTAPQTVYTGTINDSVGGTGTLTVTLGTAGSNVGGTWSTAFPGQKATNRVISGTVTGTRYSATVADYADTDFIILPNCQQTFAGTLTSGALSGTYTEVANDTCTAHSGSVSATRQ